MYRAFFSYVIQSFEPVKAKVERQRYIVDNYLFNRGPLNHMSHEDFSRKFFNTADIYGAGIALLYVLKCGRHLVATSDTLVHNFQINAENLFYMMVTPDLSKRIEIDELLNSYENILIASGIVGKHGKYFLNHELLNLTNGMKNFERKIASIPSNAFKISEKEIVELEQKLHSKDGNLPRKICPVGKIVNPVTGRCIKVNKTMRVKECPPGKIVNPATGRCIKVNKTRSVKECPFGKVVNPVTGRCIKQKRP